MPTPWALFEMVVLGGEKPAFAPRDLGLQDPPNSLFHVYVVVLQE
jgi:hypothetical protein